MGLEHFSSSDYGSGSSMNSSTSWGSQELDWQTFQSQLLNAERARTKAASFADLVSGRCTIEDVMREFRMNGSDTPYNPDDEAVWRHSIAPSYRRQVSWPAAVRPRAPRPLSASYPPRPALLPVGGNDTIMPTLTSPPAPTAGNTGGNEACEQSPPGPPFPSDELSAEQRRVLGSLSDAAVLTLLREMQRRIRRQPEECRFCKNNGERESYYRAHVLKDCYGRVQCPVLRAFVCKRCGARGDNAHTIKYCPMSTSEERIKSAAMMRSMRMASGRRRTQMPPSGGPDNYVVFGDTPAGGGAMLRDSHIYSTHTERTPLDPRWTALEQKLMLS